MVTLKKDARQMAANLHFAKERPMGPPGLQGAPFWKEAKFREIMEAKLADVPEPERKALLEFLAHAPAKITRRAEKWDREKIPSSLHEIRSPVDEFVWRLKLFVDCID
jgi:hypothetical protein